MDEHIYKVSEINNTIKELIDEIPMFNKILVTGELSNYKIYPSGHHYFTIKDESSSLKCVMFKSNAFKLRFKPENGMSVIVSGRISVYTRDGAYQLYAENILPEGAGALQLAFDQLKEKLSKEGLFDDSARKPLPEYPHLISLVTSSAGAAVRDMIRILGERWPLTEVVVVPVRVQGTEAPQEIADAIDYLNERKISDLIITGRGGGSTEDLWAFNSELVARAIFRSKIPVISAVGHEPDQTISDYVADRRASTPSNAAEIAVPMIDDVQASLNNLKMRAVQAEDAKIHRYKERLDYIKNRKVMQSPQEYIDNRKIELDHMTDKLLSSFERQNTLRRNQFIQLVSALDAMSPLAVLKRGYSIVEKNSKVTNSVRSLKVGDNVEIKFADGDAECMITEIKEQNDGK